VRRAEIEQQNRYLLDRQRQFRIAADVVTEAWMAFPEVAAVAVIGSVACQAVVERGAAVPRVPSPGHQGLA
jgi:hypothetical protein